LRIGGVLRLIQKWLAAGVVVALRSTERKAVGVGSWLPWFALHPGEPPPVGRDLVCDARAAGRRPGVSQTTRSLQAPPATRGAALL